MNHEEMRELVAAFAFDAVEPDEERLVLEHVETCDECALLLSETHEVAADLGEDGSPELDAVIAAELAGSDLRARIVAAAAEEGRPSVAPAQPSRLDEDRRPAVAVPPRRPSSERRIRRSLVRSRVLVGAVGAALAVAVAVPVTLATSGSSGRDGQTALAQALLQPGARQVALAGAPGTAAKAVVSSRGVVFFADGLAPNDSADQTYVLWAGNGSGVRPLATFDARSGKTVQVASMSLPYRPADVALLAVSLEPGRTAPTSPTKIVLSGKPA